ncbi:MAG: hypothetical protein AB7K04_18195 [Pseudorhodoplanes sp.]
MRIHPASITAGLIWLLALATPVASQTLDPQRVQCENVSLQFYPAVQITACTALLQSGRVENSRRHIYHSIRGDAYFRSGHIGQAVADFGEAIRRHPNYAAAYDRRARAYDRLGDTRRATADLAEATRLRAGSMTASAGYRTWVPVGNGGWWLDLASANRSGEVAYFDLTHPNQGVTAEPGSAMASYRPDQSPAVIYRYSYNCQTSVAQYLVNGEARGSVTITGQHAADYVRHLCR